MPPSTPAPRPPRAPVRSWLGPLLDHRRTALVLWLLLAAAAAPGLLRLSVDNSPEVFFVRQAERLQVYRDFQMDFGRDRSVRIALSGPGLWTREGLAWLGELERRAGEPGDVFAAAGLATRHRGLEGGGERGRAGPSWPPADPRAYREGMLADPLARAAGWIGREGEVVTVLVALYNVPPERQERTLEHLERLLAAAPEGVEGTLVGLPVLQRALDREVETFARGIFPVLFLLASGLLFAALARPGDVVRPLALAALCLVQVFGLRGWSGQSLNLVEILLAPLLFVIALATAVHVQMRYREMLSRQRNRLEATLDTYREKAWPVVWTGLTTAAGFGSVAVSEVPPVRSLGLWSAGGLLLLTAAALSFYPALLAMGGGVLREGGTTLTPYQRWSARLGRRWAERAVASRPYRRGLYLVFGVLALVALGGLLVWPGLQRDTDVLGYLPPDHPVRRDLARLEERGVGVVAAELVLTWRGAEGSGPGPFAGLEGLESLDRLSRSLRHVPGVLGVVGAGELWRSFRRRGPPGEDREAAYERFRRRARARSELGDLLAVLRTGDGRRARISAILPMEGFEELDPVFEELLETARREGPGGAGILGVHLTGQYPLVLAAQRRLLGTMLSSLGLTLLTVTAIFLALFRSLRVTARMLVPNLWPVLAVLGVMACGRVPLDSTTVMIAAVVLGLAVDDTLHTFGRFRREVGGAGMAVASTLEHTAPAHLLTSVVLMAGFLVCGLSGLVVIARFGVLTAVALGLALAADLLLVPALLAGIRGRRGGGSALPPFGARYRRGRRFPGLGSPPTPQ